MDLQLSPVEQKITKVNGEVAVGEDLAFQERWWRFERVMWAFFGLVVLAALLGAFGRGWLANASATAPDGSVRVEYERIERVSAPSMLGIHFAAHGDAHLHVSESVVRALGARRVVPQPKLTEIVDGLRYTFPGDGPATVELSLEPGKPGIFDFDVRLEDGAPVHARVLVLP